MSNPIIQLLMAGKNIAKKIPWSIPYQLTSDTIDQIVDPEKIALQAYADEFHPNQKQIEKLQDIKDWIGGFGSVPMAPPFLGRGMYDRGYLPIANMAMGTQGMSGMYDPYPEYALKENAKTYAREQAEDAAVRTPFQDWDALHAQVKNRMDDTIAYQAKLRRDPALLKVANGDPKKMASLIHSATLKRNEQLRKNGNFYNAGDALRGYIMYRNPLEPYNGLKTGDIYDTRLDLRNTQGMRPYIIR